MSLKTRAAALEDAEAIARIYNQGIEDRSSTFETRLRSLDDIRAWFSGPPILVAEDAGAVIAFAAASQWKTRECYRGVLEFSVYVERAQRGRGAGRLVLDALADEVRKAGYWKLLGALLVGNEGSRGLMRAAGFREVGVYQRQAQLDGQWKDVLLVEKVIS